MGALFLCALVSVVVFAFWLPYKFTKYVLTHARPGEAAYKQIEAEKLVELADAAERRRRLTRRS